MAYKKRKLGISLEEMMELAKNTTVPVVKVSQKTQSEANAFYKSQEWKDCRAAFLDGKDRICNICQCDLSATDAPKLNVDHVKPVKYYWHLRTDHSNLQLACEDCNRLKGNYTGSDIRGYVEENRQLEERDKRWREKERARRERIDREQREVIKENRDRWTRDYRRKARTVDLDGYLKGRASSVIGSKRRELFAQSTVDFKSEPAMLKDENHSGKRDAQ